MALACPAASFIAQLSSATRQVGNIERLCELPNHEVFSTVSKGLFEQRQDGRFIFELPLHLDASAAEEMPQDEYDARWFFCSLLTVVRSATTFDRVSGSEHGLRMGVSFHMLLASVSRVGRFVHHLQQTFPQVLNFAIFTNGPISPADAERARGALQTTLRQFCAGARDSTTVTVTETEFTRLLQVGINTVPADAAHVLTERRKSGASATKQASTKRDSAAGVVEDCDECLADSSSDSENPYAFRGSGADSAPQRVPMPQRPSEQPMDRHVQKKRKTTEKRAMAVEFAESNTVAGIDRVEVVANAEWKPAEVLYNGTWRCGATVAPALDDKNFLIARWGKAGYRGEQRSRHSRSEVRLAAAALSSAIEPIMACPHTSTSEVDKAQGEQCRRDGPSRTDQCDSEDAIPLRRRDGAGLAVPTVCADVERLCTKLKEEDVSLKVYLGVCACLSAALRAPAFPGSGDHDDYEARPEKRRLARQTICLDSNGRHELG